MRPARILAVALTVLACAVPLRAEERSPSPHGKVETNAQSKKRRVVRSPGLTVIARADAYSVPRGGTLVQNAFTGVLANDTAPAGLNLVAVLVTNVAHGTLTLAVDGSFTYVNDSSAATSDSFTYKAQSGALQSQATVTISISGPPPQANNDTYPVPQGAPLNIAAPGVLANDTVSDAAIKSYGVNGSEQTSIGSATPTAQGGSTNLNANGSFTYNAPSPFSGTDTFKYTLGNASGSSTAQVTLNVLPTPPSAVNDGFSTTQNTTLNEPAPGVLANDFMSTGAITSYGKSTGTEQISIGASTATAQNGTVQLNANGSVTYTPPSGFTGSDSFKYILSNTGGSSTATVTITVQAGNAPDFIVTSPGFFYMITGFDQANPDLTLQRGRTYTFKIQASPSHPFEILNAPAGSVTNNNISNGIITFAVPAGAGTYNYHCSIHEFGAEIRTTP